MSDWSDFGDYFWQYLSLIISIINVYLFISINRTLSKQNFVLAEISIMQNILNSVIDFINLKFSNVSDYKKVDNYNCLLLYLRTFKYSNKEFFNIEKTTIEDLILQIEKCRQFFDNNENSNNSSQDESPITDFIISKERFISSISSQIRNYLDNKEK